MESLSLTTYYILEALILQIYKMNGMTEEFSEMVSNFEYSATFPSRQHMEEFLVGEESFIPSEVSLYPLGLLGVDIL